MSTYWTERLKRGVKEAIYAKTKQPSLNRGVTDSCDVYYCQSYFLLTKQLINLFKEGEHRHQKKILEIKCVLYAVRFKIRSFSGTVQ